MATERITAPKVMDILEEHLHLHRDKLDPKVHNHQVILFGERGDNGLCSTAKDHEKRINDLEKLKSELSNVKWAVIAAIAINVVLRFLPA